MKLTKLHEYKGIFIFFVPLLLLILFFYPASLAVKVTLVLNALILGLLTKPKASAKDTRIQENEERFYLKRRRIRWPLILAIFFLIYDIFSNQSSIITFTCLVIVIILFVSLIMEHFYESDYPKQYISLKGQNIETNYGDSPIDLKKAKYVSIDTTSLTIYEKYQHHKIRFEKFESGENLRRILIEKVNRLKIMIK